MIYYFGVFMGAFGAVYYETICRYYVDGSFWYVLPYAIPSALLVSFGVWSAMQVNSSLLAGMVMWGMGTTTMRLLSTIFILKESPTPGAWAGFCLLVLAQILVKVIK